MVRALLRIVDRAVTRLDMVGSAAERERAMPLERETEGVASAAGLPTVGRKGR